MILCVSRRSADPNAVTEATSRRELLSDPPLGRQAAGLESPQRHAQNAEKPARALRSLRSLAARFGSAPEDSPAISRLPRPERTASDFEGGGARQSAATRRGHGLRRGSDLLIATLLTLVFSVGVIAKEAEGEDWPQLLGPRANGISVETGLLDKWGADGPPLVWSKEIGTGYSAPSVRGERLVLHHRVGGEEVVECLEAATGKPQWRHAYPSAFVDPYGYNNGPRGTPLLTTNRCYTFGAEGKLVCLELQTGKLIWQRDTDKDWQVPPAFFGVGSSPILEANLLLVMVGGQPNSGIVAFDPATGKTVWESVGEKNWQGVPMTGWPGERTVQWQQWEKQASYATPVAATVNGRRQVFCLMRQGLVSLNPTNGAVHASLWFRARVNDSVNASNPIIVDDHVFISAAYYKVGAVLLRVKPAGQGFEEIWRSTVLENHWMTPILYDGFLYAFSGRNEPDARFRCVELKTGKVMWDRDEGWPPHSTPQPKVFGRGSCILADGKLIALGEGGLLGLFKVNPKELEEICRWQAPQLRHPCWAAPVLSRKRLYLRSEDRLVCVNLAK
ncbi:MAG: PQQ-binding-like beta-propeller repeat protein [Verrucomicrobia bacterium]|nr:PQQ-binding-like beta-propeller repeat protein [Verrucomicrobiota bacterium]